MARKKLIIATRNKDKVKEFNATLADLDIEILSALDFPELPEVVEDQDTLEGNARKKAETIYQATGLPTVADDTGLMVNFLEGKPGVFSSRYAGENATYSDNVNKLLAQMRDAAPDQRTAQFVTVLAFSADDHMHFFRGICQGIITEAPRGTLGFGYDPVFLVPEKGKTFAEMSLEEKNRISHRGRALKKFKEYLAEHF